MGAAMFSTGTPEPPSPQRCGEVVARRRHRGRRARQTRGSGSAARVHRLAVVVVSMGLGLASVLGAIVLAEWTVAPFTDPRFTPRVGAPDTDGPVVRPEFRVRTRTNAAGFRGPALPGPKPRGVYRLVVLGDAFTWGHGVRERQAYPKRLEQRLNARRGTMHGRGSRVEVVNLGLVGAGPRDFLYHLEHTGLALAPDLVIVGLSAIDVDGAYQMRRFGVPSPLTAVPAARATASAPRPWWRLAIARVAPNLTELASRTAHGVSAGPPEALAAPRAGAAVHRPPAPIDVIAALGDRYQRRLEIVARYTALPRPDRDAVDAVLGGTPHPADSRSASLVAALVDPDAKRDRILLRSAERREAWRETGRTLERLVGVAHRRGAEVLLAVFPVAEEVDSDRWPALASVGYRVDPLMLSDTTLPDRVRDVAMRSGARFVDLVAPFRAHGADGRYFVLDEHWTGRGHALAAARIAGALGDASAPR